MVNEVRVVELNMGKVEIMRVNIEDAKELLEIYKPYVEGTAISFEYEVPSIEEFQNRIRTISARLPYIKAVYEGKIVGYAYASAFKVRKAYDYSVEATVYIKKELRRSCLGKALYEVLG